MSPKSKSSKKKPKRSKQYYARVLGLFMAVTFDVAELRRVKVKADRRDLSIERLIEKTVSLAAKRRRWKSRDDLESLAVKAIQKLGAPVKSKTRNGR